MLEVRPGKFVPNFGYRYLSEDVPFGLVATHALAEIADVKTPTIDEVITWTQSVLKTNYIAGGRLQGADTGDLRIPQNYGITTLSELIDWYSQRAPTFGVSRLREPAIPR
jgi:hypothetical protein